MCVVPYFIWEIVSFFETSLQKKLCFLHKVMFPLVVRSSVFFSEAQLLNTLLETLTGLLNVLEPRQ